MIHSTIGNTPLRKDDYLSAKYNTTILVKEEFHNPGKSSKDRAAWFMVEDAIRNKKIKEGGTFVEASSGNTGISIALIAQELGYKAKIFVSASCSDEKIALLESYGASIERCDNSNGLHVFNSTQYLAQAYAANHDNTYFTNQYYNSNNIKAHYRTTGPELWEQTNGAVTHVIAGVGTGGSISGIGRFLKEQRRSIKIWGVEPLNSVYTFFLNQQPIPEDLPKFDDIEGIGRTFIPGSFDRNAVDRIFQVERLVSLHAAIAYRESTDELVGFSSAAVLAALETHSNEMKFSEDDVVVLFFPDHGDRYLHKIYHSAEVKQLILAANYEPLS
ncbi:PLP-dependent cysteine synthase family protein [Sphingobacterium lactis]|uniref:Cystathionine beta-synthase n=1 Tax=Sphingobacterium lactis TaxID=797291 RepID=A0A1H5YIL6_9SPHI|nr:cysteine synthase family protein [Sphingobacterium lactis]SEG23963.1 cystathionine beta-synthase [Sphingobacterium lactis]